MSDTLKLVVTPLQLTQLLEALTIATKAPNLDMPSTLALASLWAQLQQQARNQPEEPKTTAPEPAPEPAQPELKLDK